MGGLINYISGLMVTFNTYAKDNQFVAGVISLWGLGVISYFCKDIPLKIWANIKKFSTTTITLTSAHDTYHMFLKWYEQKGYAKKGRYIKISNGRWGDSEMIKSIGYGTHYFWYRWKLIILTLTSKETVGTERDKDELSMIMLGRSHKIFDQIFNEVVKTQQGREGFVIKKFKDDWWRRSSEQRPRKMETIFLREGIKEKLIRHLDKFIDMEDWYINAGIPYQTGILLYGPPGTGKTSLIKAIANYLNYQIHILGASSLYKIEEAMFNLPEKSLICIEDIDTNSATRERYEEVEEVEECEDTVVDCIEGDEPDVESKAVKNKKDPKNIVLNLNFANLSDILNAIDGVQTNHGRILILTTNNVDQLDRALLRPGRIDLILEIGYVNNYVVKQFMNKFYSYYSFDYSDFKVKDEISLAYIQNLMLENMDNPGIILSKLRKD